MRRLVLYTGEFCPLCDKAKALIYPLLPVGQSLVEVEIDADPGLKARYGLRIPVFAVEDDKGNTLEEKGWPFTAGQVRRMIE